MDNAAWEIFQNYVFYVYLNYEILKIRSTNVSEIWEVKNDFLQVLLYAIINLREKDY